MSPGAACPLCLLGILARLCETRWLRCPACNRSYDTHGHAYDLDWRPVPMGAT